MKLGPVLVGIEGTALSAESRERLHHPLVGGVVLFSRNFESRDQVRELSMSIRELREPRLLLAVDQEGGRVQRFRDGFTHLPPLGRIGAKSAENPEQAPEYAYWHGRMMAEEMLDVGVDLSFAPVLDLDRGSDVIGDRAFCADPDVVCALGRAYLAGMSDAGMKATGKHFPGHGSIRADSHIEDVCDERSFDEIRATDLRPFAELATQLKAMMIAHVVYPCLDDKPAGYSAAWLHDTLRRDIGFEGVIFSDDLGMHAAKSLGSLAQRTRAALEAGCDSVLVCRPEDVDALCAEWKGDDRGPCPSQKLEALYGQPGGRPRIDDATRSLWRAKLEQLHNRNT